MYGKRSKGNLFSKQKEVCLLITCEYHDPLKLTVNDRYIELMDPMIADNDWLYAIICFHCEIMYGINKVLIILFLTYSLH